MGTLARLTFEHCDPPSSDLATKESPPVVDVDVAISWIGSLHD